VYGSNNNYLGYQTLSGTGSLWLANQILNLVNLKNVITADVTWPNHNQIFNIIDTYKYSNNLDSLLTKINNSKNTVFLFQSCCHNPTGIDYCKYNWDIIGDAITKNNHTVIMDNAYQGLASGNPQVDNYSIKMFDKLHIPMIVCSSYAKNFGLYNQRLGSLFTNFKVDNLDDYIKKIIRSSYSNPPAFGTVIFNKIVDDHYKEWEMECLNLTKSLKNNREMIYSKLKSKNITWDNLVDGNGLFYLSPLNESQINTLSQEHSIYMLKNGRINIAGINETNIDYII
jgi:aspartate aminotransferase